MRRGVLLVVAGASMLGGCVPALSPNPPSATVAVPDKWRTPLAVQAPLDSDWWRLFEDPALDDLVAAARANNPDIAVAAAKIAEARGQLRVARAALLPQLEINAPFSYSRMVNAFGKPIQQRMAMPVAEVDYQLDLFGANDASRDAARASLIASIANEEAVRLNMTAMVVNSYVTLRALDLKLKILRDTLVSRAESLALTKEQFEVGYADALSYKQAEGEYYSVKQQIPAMQLMIAKQEDSISVLTGVTPRTIMRGDQLHELKFPPVPASLPSELTRRRPDIAQAEYQLVAANDKIRNARAQFLPQINLKGTYGWDYSSKLPQTFNIWSIGGSILAPLFKGGQLRGNFDVATAQRDQAAFNYEKVVLTAFQQVEDALASVDRVTAQEADLIKQRAAAVDALKHAKKRYRAGYDSYLNELDTQRTLLQVDLSAIQARNDRLNAYVALYQALGGGWMWPADARPSSDKGPVAEPQQQR